MEIKRVLIIVFLILIFFVTVKYSGFVVQTRSSVNIDEGILVLASTFNGSTTDFLNMNDSQLEDVESMTLETGYGKIIFTQNVNLTKDVENNIVDLDSNVNISHNHIEVNTTKLTSLETAATLALYGLSFNNPRILRNSEPCSASICTIQSYSSGILTFKVTQFSLYSAEETPAAASQPVISGGGGGGGISVSNFTIDKDLIRVTMKQGETRRETLEITNTGNTGLDISLEKSVTNLAISENSFYLKPKETKILNLDFFAGEDEAPDSYIGRIIISAGGIIKVVNVISEVRAKKPLFDVETRVTKKYARAGEPVDASILVTNLGDLKHIDVILHYAIRGFDGREITFREESVAIENKLTLDKTLILPRDIQPGIYIFYSRVYYWNVSASSSDTFDVREVEMPLGKYTGFIVTISFFVLLALIIIFISTIRKRARKK